MRVQVGDLMHVRASGRMACYTRPEFRTERFSNVVGSASAWDGMLSQIMGHVGAHYLIESVALLFHPRWVSHTINEIADFGNGLKPIDTERKNVRTLRTTSFVAGNRRLLRRRILGEVVESETAGVDYVVSFRLVSTDLQKHQDMLRRRLRNGHYWRQPYFGLRELPAMVEQVKRFDDLLYPSDTQLVEHENGLKTADYSASLGLTFYGVDWVDPAHPYYFAPLEVRRGIATYPTWDDVRRLGIRREGRRC